MFFLPLLFTLLYFMWNVYNNFRSFARHRIKDELSTEKMDSFLHAAHSKVFAAVFSSNFSRRFVEQIYETLVHATPVIGDENRKPRFIFSVAKKHRHFLRLCMMVDVVQAFLHQTIDVERLIIIKKRKISFIWNRKTYLYIRELLECCTELLQGIWKISGVKIWRRKVVAHCAYFFDALALVRTYLFGKFTRRNLFRKQ